MVNGHMGTTKDMQKDNQTHLFLYFVFVYKMLPIFLMSKRP